MRKANRKDAVAGVLALAVMAAGPWAWGATIYWAGAQYTPGPGYPAAWPTAGSYFDKDNWLGGVLPTSSSSIVFGGDQSMPNGNTGHDPHIIHFGNFGYYGTTVIPGGTGSLTVATILQDNWTFDFGGGQNAGFTGTLTPSIGAMNVGTLVLSPAAGQSASLTVQNGTLTATALRVATDGGQGLLTMATGGFVKTNGSTIGVSGVGSFVQSSGTHSVIGSLVLGANSGVRGVYGLDGGLVTISANTYIGYFGAGSFTQSGGTHTNTSIVALGFNAGGTGVYILNNGQMNTKYNEYVGYSGSGSFIQDGGTHAVSGTFCLGYSLTGTGLYTLNQGQLTTNIVKVGSSGTGTFHQNGGTHTVTGTITVGGEAGSAGSYVLSGGQLASVNARIAGTGNFTQSGGTHTVSTSFTVDNGIGAGGVYALNNGVLTAKKERIGYNGTGTFIQSGGTHTISDNFYGLSLGDCPDAVGLYILSDGQLATADEYVGNLGTGSFSQSGGTHSISSSLSLGGSSGLYELNGGQLTVGAESVGCRQGVGTFTQTGGTHTVVKSLSVGTPSGPGIYTLSGGVLSASSESIGSYSAATGSFTQTGGTHTIGLLTVASQGFLSVTGGTLQLTGGLVNRGTVIVGGAVTLRAGGLTDLTRITLQDIGGVGLVVAANSLVVLPAGTTPGQFASFSNEGGIVGYGGSAITIPAGVLVNDGRGECYSPIVCAGTLTGSATLIEGIQVQGDAASATLGFLRVKDSVSGITGGQLNTQSVDVGYSGNGSFTQSGGTHTCSRSLLVGSTAGFSGEYTLSNGQLSTLYTEVGLFGPGRFIQSGGTHTVSGMLRLGLASEGTYTLSNGLLSVGSGGLLIFANSMLSLAGGTLLISGGIANQGSLVLGGTTHVVAEGMVDLGHATLQDLRQVKITLAANSLLILPTGVSPTDFGAFTNNGGMIATAEGPVVIPAGTLVDAGNGGCRELVICAGTLTGGEVKCFGGFQIQGSGASVAVESLQLEGTGSSLTIGQLNVANEIVGNYVTGTFTQSGGTHNVSNTFSLGARDKAVGCYILSDGLLTARLEFIGNGTFTQSGGTHNISSGLYLGIDSGHGTYILSGGTVTASLETIGEDGASVFIQTGGTHTASTCNIGENSQADSYTLSGGQFSVMDERLGNGGVGIFSHSGGTHTVSRSLVIGAPGGAANITSGTYSLSGSGVLTVGSLLVGGDMEAIGSTGVLSISNGTATVANTLKLWNSTGSSLALSGGTLAVGALDISANPGGFFWTGGMLLITGSALPAMTIPSGGTIKGAITVQGDLTNHGTLAPGNSPGVMTVQGNFSQTAAASLELEIGGKASGLFDRLVVQGNLELGGTVALELLPGYVPQVGDAFDLVDWNGSFTGSGFGFDFSRAVLPEGMRWETGGFATSGVVSVEVPEPASVGLVMAGAMGLLGRRRRR